MLDPTQKRLDDLEKRVEYLESEIKILRPDNNIQGSANLNNSQININIPEALIEKIFSLDETSQIPILWYHSNKPVMTVKEFLTACAEKGFTLSHSWLPSAGGSFSGTFVKKGGIFHDVKIKGKGNEKYWKLTDVGKFKTNKIINEIKK